MLLVYRNETLSSYKKKENFVVTHLRDVLQFKHVMVLGQFLRQILGNYLTMLEYAFSLRPLWYW
jgi:hypothetical protein